MARIFFKGLNEIRAIAALSVLFHHIELYKASAKEETLYNVDIVKYFIGYLGANGVDIFFVLSGFLITYLLLAEKTTRNTIALKKFYFRRILRIWPLYYFIVFLSFVVVPVLAQNIPALQAEPRYYHYVMALVESPWITLALFLAFLPNLALITRPPVVGASQTWSVGVEEQFYIIWPQIILRVSRKYLLYAFLTLALLPVWVEVTSVVAPGIGEIGRKLIGLLPIYMMAIGGIGAYFLFYHKESIAPFFRSAFLFGCTTVALILLLFTEPNKMLFAVVVVMQILFVIQNHFKINLRSKILSKIGDISYGIYMYHPIVMYLCFAAIHSVMGNAGPAYHFAVYCSIVPLTLLVSHLSYQYFEKRFIDYKNRKFTVIESGKAASR